MNGSCMFTIAQPLNAMCGFQALAYNFPSWQKKQTNQPTKQNAYRSLINVSVSVAEMKSNSNINAFSY